MAELVAPSILMADPSSWTALGVFVPADLAGITLRGLEVIVARERPPDPRVGTLAGVLLTAASGSGCRDLGRPVAGWMTRYAALKGIPERAARHRAATGLVRAQKDRGRWLIEPRV